MRSPKHRVLQQREYLAGNVASAQPQNPGNYFSPRDQNYEPFFDPKLC